MCFQCPDCRGVSIGIAPMRKLCGDQKFLSILWQTARHGYSNPGRSCPHCQRPMRTVTLPLNGVPIELDVCSKCSVIWFDPGEFERVPAAKPDKDDDLPQEAKEILAIKMAQMEGDRLDSELSQYERKGRYGGRSGGWIDAGDLTEMMRGGGGGAGLVVAAGVAVVWCVIKMIEFIGDYRRLQPGAKKTRSSSNWGEEVSYETFEEPVKPEKPEKKEQIYTSKDYGADDYYKMD